MRMFLWQVSGAVLAIFVTNGRALAETTPMAAKLAEDGVTTIECSVHDPRENLGVFSNISNGSDNPLNSTKTEGYHYKLYLPKGYYANPESRYPCLFISSPGGNANMGGFAERLKRDEWIVVMLQEARNGSPDWLRNFLAAHDDVVRRVRIARGAIFATGMSGGARCSSVYAVMRPDMAGIICQAAGFAYGHVPLIDPYHEFPGKILVAATFGDNDKNIFESQRLRRRLKQCRVQVLFFKGGHNWCPSAVFDAALDWIEDCLFVQAADPKKGGSASAVLQSRPDNPSEDASRWYYRKCKMRLNEAKGKPARWLAIERLLAVIGKGMLGKDRAIADEAREWRLDLSTLRTSQEVMDFDKTVRKAFREAQDAEKSYAEVMKPVQPESGKMQFSPVERMALQKAIEAYRVVVNLYPEAPLAFEAKPILTSLEVEASKAQ